MSQSSHSKKASYDTDFAGQKLRNYQINPKKYQVQKILLFQLVILFVLNAKSHILKT